MTATTIDMRGRVDAPILDSGATDNNKYGSLKTIAKVTGALYLGLFIIGMFSPLVLESLVVSDSAIKTAENLLSSKGLLGFSLVTWFVIVVVDVVVSITLYLLLQNSGRVLSMTMAAFRLVYSVFLGAFLLDLYGAYELLVGSEGLAGMDLTQTYTAVAAGVAEFQRGFQFALMFFGVHLVLLGVAIIRSGRLPRALGLIVFIAGFGYVIDGMIIFTTGNHNESLSIALLSPAVIAELGLPLWLLFRGVRESSKEAVVTTG